MSVISVFSHKVSTLGKTIPGIQLVGGSTKMVREKIGKREGESLSHTPPLCFSLTVFHTAPSLMRCLEQASLGWSLHVLLGCNP